MEDKAFKKTGSVILFTLLVILAMLVLKPVFISIILGLVLAFVFTPVYGYLNKYLTSSNISAGVIVVLLLIIIILPIWFLTPIILNQSFSLFQATQQIDFVSPLQSIFPSLFASEQFSSEIGSVLSSFSSKVANSLVNSIAQIILDFPRIALQLMVVFFTFFFALRDKELLIEYVKSILPFSKEVEKKLFEKSKIITSAVLYGQVVVGIIQGVVIGIGFFIFRVPNALLLTFLSSLAGIFPIVGTVIVWLPVAIYLFIAGNMVPAWGVVIFGLLSSNIDNVLRPIIVSKRAKINTGILLVSTIGGIFFFGILGFILGPLIISYLLVLLEVYRGKPTPGLIIENQQNKD